MAADCHVGDIGTEFILQIVKQDGSALDVSTASLLQLIFKKPSGAKLTKTAVANTTGTDGKIKYVAIAGDLDAAGGWAMQAKVVVGTKTYYTSITAFRVDANL